MTRVIANLAPRGTVALECHLHSKPGKTFTRYGSGGQVTVDLAPTGPGDCWVVTRAYPIGETRFVKVPVSAEPVFLEDLVVVDPATLQPTTTPPPPDWYAEIEQIKDQIDAPTVPRGVVHTQVTSSTVWDVPHELGIKPGGVLVKDVDGNTLHGDITYPADGIVRITFPVAVAGTVYLS